MNTWQRSLSGFLCIAALVGVGMLHANDPDMQRWPLSTFKSDGPTLAPETQGFVSHIDWSADGQLLLSSSHGGAGAEAHLALHDIARKTISMPIDFLVNSIAVSALAPDGRHVLIGSWNGRLWWLPVEGPCEPTLILEMPRDSMFTAAAVAGDGRQFAAGTGMGAIYLCGADRRPFVTLTCSRPSAVVDLRFSRDGARLVVAQSNGRISLWDVETGQWSQEFLGHEQRTRAEFLPDGKRIISAGYDDTVRIWEIASGRELWRGEFGLFRVSALAVSDDGATAAWGGFNRKIVVWDLEAGKKKLDIATPTAIIDLKFSPDGSLFASAGMDGTIRLYDARTGTGRPGFEIDGWQIVRAEK